MPFSGDSIHNPYEGIDSAHWLKANFHVHSRTLFGVLNGRENSPHEIFSIYNYLGYDVISISNYQNINSHNSFLPSFIPVYEHGFNIQKVHQLCLGAKHVLWFDFPIYQSVNQKQYIISLHKKNTGLVALNHPSWNNAYNFSDVAKISGYELFEAMNQNKYSLKLWDAALSAGKPAYMISNDDAHDIADPHEVGRCCTYIYSESTNSRDILNALRMGRAFGAELHMADDETFQQKAMEDMDIPVIKNIEVKNETLFIKLSADANTIRFIGQYGIIHKTLNDLDSADYRFNKYDSYIRTEIVFYDGTKFFLNPVYRTLSEDNLAPSNTLPEINRQKTLLSRLSISSIIIVLMFILFSKKKKS
jgi:hypothetical protein